MSKTSYDYAELAGISITITHIKSLRDSSLNDILTWLQARQKELENK